MKSFGGVGGGTFSAVRGEGGDLLVPLQSGGALCEELRGGKLPEWCGASLPLHCWGVSGRDSIGDAFLMLSSCCSTGLSFVVRSSSKGSASFDEGIPVCRVSSNCFPRVVEEEGSLMVDCLSPAEAPVFSVMAFSCLPA